MLQRRFKIQKAAAQLSDYSGCRICSEKDSVNFGHIVGGRSVKLRTTSGYPQKAFFRGIRALATEIYILISFCKFVDEVGFAETAITRKRFGQFRRNLPQT